MLTQMQFKADYFDGISPRANQALVTIDETHFILTLAPVATHGMYVKKNLKFLITDCSIQAKLGSGRRLIDLPNDGRLETDFQHLELYLPKKSSHTFWRAVHYAETHKLAIAAAFASIVLTSLLLLKYGVPIVAKYAAMATPPNIENSLGKQTLETLEHKKLGYFTASELPIARQQTIQNSLETMCKKTGDCPSYQLNFRKSPTLGANAFALPGGYLIMTDELVTLANNDHEITAVLAHELGHVKGRHALRQALQGTISGLIVIAITGDVSSIAAGLPAVALNMSYTRELETDADHYAIQSLKTACIPTKYFATLLLRLEKSHGEVSVPEMISSHPDTKSRILPFLKDDGHCT